MEASFDFAVVGAGIAGVSVAAALAGNGTLALIEAEAQPGYHSTGRSAAILAQNYGSRTVRALTAASEGAFRDPPPGFAEAPLLTRRGLVRIARTDQRERLGALYREMTDVGSMRWMEGSEIEARVPLLRKGHVAAGFINEAAADIDVHALMQGYLRAAKAGGARLLTGAAVEDLAREGGAWRLSLADGTRFGAAVVVNAAGAWADRVAEMAGVAALGLAPLRRSAVTFAAPEGCDVAALPMVVDADEAFYLKPEAGQLMASPADETLAAPGDSRPEEIDIAVCIDRIERCFEVEVRRIHASWSGLRTFAPDREPVCGFDRDVPGFFWLAGQGGSGVQTAPALARLAAEEILGRGGQHRLRVAGLAPEALSPGRFGREGSRKRTTAGERR